MLIELSGIPKFAIGSLAITPGARSAINGDSAAVSNILRRHTQGDWGEVCDEDKLVNDEALQLGMRLLSAYTVNEEKLWIITEHDRSVTTILKPEEY